jgi:hypothetical protein
MRLTNINSSRKKNSYSKIRAVSSKKDVNFSLNVFHCAAINIWICWHRYQEIKCKCIIH